MPDNAVKPRVIALWSVPRSRSTVFFRAMLERGDLTALHEPFCNIVDYGETTVVGEQVRTAGTLITRLRGLGTDRPVFFKDTTDYRQPEVLADEQFLAETTHTFLIRRPAEVAASYYALKPDITQENLGFRAMAELFAAVTRCTGHAPLVIDSDDLVDHPDATIGAYCERVGLPFLPEALSWQPGARSEWHRSGRWHERASDTSGIQRTESQYAHTADSNTLLAELAAQDEPLYQSLREERLRP